MKHLLLCLALVHTLEQICDAYKILVVFPMPSKSHTILGDAMVRYLLDARHEVTYINPIPIKNAHTNLTQIDVSENFNAMPKDLLSIDAIMDKKVDFNNHEQMFHFFSKIAVMTIQNKNVQKLVNDLDQKFDVIIAEWMFSELYAGFAAIFNCPYIWYSSMDSHWMVLRLIDERPNPAYIPDVQSANMPPFGFWERVQELWIQISKLYKRITVYNNIEETNYNTYFAPIIAKRGYPVPPFDEITFNASLMIANSHVSLGQVQSLPPNLINIGGYHINSKVPALPQDLQQIMDKAKHGVIYFSMGSNLKATKLPEVLKKGILKMFGSLKQTVLWKFEEDMPGTPNNVHILHWAPQQSILAHPNCVLFITHGGYLSTTETVHFGVPIIGIPVFADQFINVDRAKARGFAERVDLSYDMVDKLKIAIEEVVSNPRYKEKAKELSQIYHDRPVSPGKELVHWVEHVVKTRGAPHLRSPALMLPWYQKMYLDLAAVVAAGLISLILILKRLYSKLFSSNKKIVKQKKK